MKWRFAGVASAVALGTSLLLARAHPFGDADLLAGDGAGAALRGHSSLPADVREIMGNKCADCHSMQTRMPIYDKVAARLAPFSWLMERDVVKGRKAMNLDLWDTYSVDQRATFAAKMAQKARTGEMPLLQYRVIHWGTRINADEVRVLSQWAHGADGPATGSGMVVDGDAARGAIVFNKRCTGCHSLTQDHEGPRLKMVYGRTSGSVPGFGYSAALKDAHVVWGDQTLQRWLEDPESVVPGTNMDFRVVRSQERADLVRFLRASAGR